MSQKLRTWDDIMVNDRNIREPENVRRRMRQKSQKSIIGSKNMLPIDVPQSLEKTRNETFWSLKTFVELGASDEAIAAATKQGVERPSKIQALSFPKVLNARHCIIADQTGSGKTLAYLLPLMQSLRAWEKENGRQKLCPGRPKVLIVTPTSQLAQQVHLVAKRLSRHLHLRCLCFTGAYNHKEGTRGAGYRTQVDLLKEGMDLLVATPGRINALLKDDCLRTDKFPILSEKSLENCRHIVLDEVDIFYQDPTFQLASIGTKSPVSTQFIFVTATLPRDIFDMIKAEFPGVHLVSGPGLHRVAPGIEQVLVDCSGPKNEPKNENTGLKHKSEALISALEMRNMPRTLIFCNTIKRCREVENTLRRYYHGEKCHPIILVYHKAIDPNALKTNLKQFMKQNQTLPVILICTDSSSRGMDFDRADVPHVVLYDFPRDPIEYMRRIGRTARAGRKGVVTILVWGRQLPLARKVMLGVKGA